MGQLRGNFRLGDVTREPYFSRIGQRMPYNFVADSIGLNKLRSRLSSNEVQFYAENGCFAFSRPPLMGLGATYDVHFRLIGKRVFLLVSIKHFC